MQGTVLPPGRYVLLYSGGLDSSYLYAHLTRMEGVEVIPLHAYISRPTLAAALANLRRLAPRPEKLIVVSNHAALLRAARRRLARLGLTEYTCIVCKTLMLLEAGRLLEKLGGVGVVTGETLGQVASQTLPNMHVIHYYAGVPVYTPLLSLDKHEASNLMAGRVEKTPSCPFLPRRPLKRADFHEALMVLEEVGVRRLAELAVYDELVV